MCRFSIHILIIVVLSAPVSIAQQRDTAQHPIPKVIKLESGEKNYLRLLSGPPETSTMRSGLVTLSPKKSVGEHSTEGYEELVIVLEGQGEMQLGGGQKLSFKKGEVVYCPLHTKHDVLNTGPEDLQYIYVVAEAKK